MCIVIGKANGIVYLEQFGDVTIIQSKISGVKLNMVI
jgi:hypothetical protein